MNQFVQNSIDFSVECQRHNGLCEISRKNILFLDDGNELDAVSRLQLNCGHVVVIPVLSNKNEAMLYHTGCQRMTDVVRQIFQDNLKTPVSLPLGDPEMTLGELHRHSLVIPYDDSKARVARFNFKQEPDIHK